jgi:EVE domain-containing protein
MTARNDARNGARSCWIGVTSSDHVALAVAGGFVELNHGKAGPLERMRAGDGFAYYSPRSAYPDGERVQAFTALGRVTGERIFQADTGGGFFSFRRQAVFLRTSDAPIKLLLDALTFVRSKTHWGAALRFGFLRVPEEDFARIAAAMRRDFAADFPAAGAVLAAGDRPAAEAAAAA